ncbi:MAG: Gfo/Idh/MocA family oxidoreductase [Gammaproteobacteria bacterium]|nr:Gfo/Idh/MocA family oxidoreductase [Gammaproteobacteria bacterium]
MGQKYIAVLGVGSWGKNIVRVCYELGVLAAICDHDAKKADLFSFEYEVANKSWQEILADQNIMGVFIALPPHLHEKYATEALQANKHVFIEKPLAMSYLEALKISSAAKLSNKIVMVGHILQYHNAYIKLKELASSGVIGEIQYIESTRLHLGPIRKEVGIIWELIPHDLSMILGLINSKVTNIQVCQQELFKHNIPASDIVDVQIEFGSIQTRIYSSWLHPKKEQKLWVVGTEGMLIFEDTQPWEHKLKLYKYNDYCDNKLQLGRSIPIEVHEPLKTEVQHFINCMNAHTIPWTDQKEGCTVVQILEQIAEISNKASEADKKLNNKTQQLSYQEQA